jgi:hypothetical protein
MKVALAHENCHLDDPTAVNRDDFGGNSSRRISTPASPMPYLGLKATPSTDHEDAIKEDAFMKATMPEL